MVVTGYLSFLISVKIFSCVLVNYRIDFCCVRANIKKKFKSFICLKFVLGYEDQVNILGPRSTVRNVSGYRCVSD